MKCTKEQYEMDTHFPECSKYNEDSLYQCTCICNMVSITKPNQQTYMQSGRCQADAAKMQSGITLCQDCIDKRNQPRCADCGCIIGKGQQ